MTFNLFDETDLSQSDSAHSDKSRADTTTTEASGSSESGIPLAARMRPQTMAEVFGQQHLLSDGRPLSVAIERDLLHSMIFWGPPGVGKTTLARLLANTSGANFITLSAVLHGVKDIREVGERSRMARSQGMRTLVFVDEVHRFNKAQQDAFLPFVEEGDFIFVGATTENPSFELNSALLSRARIYPLKRLHEQDIVELLNKTLADSVKGLGNRQWAVESGLLNKIAMSAQGDARQALNLLETMADLAQENNGIGQLNGQLLADVAQLSVRRFDKGGDIFHQQISALHKSVRGSDPDAALYWFARMIDGGCDPLYIARRVVRMASEDIGNADPRGLDMAIAGWEVQERLGSPEGELAIAQAIVYLSVAPKSNAVYKALAAAMETVKTGSDRPVPLHLRNAPTQLMKGMGYGKHYRYAHDEPEAYAAGENYWPEGMSPKKFYHPVTRGLELKIAEKLTHLRDLDHQFAASLNKNKLKK